MGLSCGIVGLPNVGKSTIFNAITKAGAPAENFPFCTIEPNLGVVKVPDQRLAEIAKRIKPQQLIPALMEFTDIAGLVKGAATGEGLGNKFLSHIRETSAIAHVVRCFEDPNVIHVDGGVDPIRDVEVIDTALMLADLETVVKRAQALEREAKKDPKAAEKKLDVVRRVKLSLEAGKPARAVEMSPDEELLIQDLHLITIKRVVYVGNVDEGSVANPMENPHYRKLAAHAEKEGSKIVAICGKIEAEIAELSDEDKAEFLATLGLKEEGLARLIREAYSLLGLQTYFTAGEKEVRAWTIHNGDTAPKAAGVIHTDFERGFIKAEVYAYDDLVKFGTEAAVKAQGLLRMEGKEYVVKDGDIMHFRFNV